MSGLVGRQGFEPWKPMASGLQPDPFVHSGTCPIGTSRNASEIAGIGPQQLARFTVLDAPVARTNHPFTAGYGAYSSLMDRDGLNQIVLKCFIIWRELTYVKANLKIFRDLGGRGRVDGITSLEVENEREQGEQSKEGPARTAEDPKKQVKIFRQEIPQ